MENADTIAAIATSAGAGGVGVIRVSGPGVPALIQAFTGRRLITRYATFVRFLDEDGGPIDEGLALFFESPHSYTGEDVFEIQAHGSPVGLNRLLKRCLALGARLAEPGEFTKRAFLNGKLDLAQAEAVADLIAARTEQAARCATRSLLGEFSNKIKAFQRELMQLRVVLEASLDFPEEGIEALDRLDVPERLHRLRASLECTLRTGQAGKLLREGISLVLVGPPNAGKSSIINVLCGDDVAIVTPLPGTTRDLIKEVIQIEGIPIQIVDTAGVRKAADIVEEQGIARTWAAAQGAEVVLVVVDETSEAEFDERSLARLPAQVCRIWLHNKIDVLGLRPRVEVIAGETHVWISALTGSGLDTLRQSIVAAVAPDVGAQTPFAAREHQLAALRSARSAIAAAFAVIDSPELAAEELRLGQAALSKITGEVTSDDVLGEIFSTFCIGK